MKQKKLITSILFSIVSVGILYAQETTVSTGGLATGTGGTSSFSIGQAFYTTNTGAGGTMSQGVQQVYDISTSLGEEITTIKLELSVFPNPTKDYLNLKIDNELWNDLTFQLYDMQGKVIAENSLVESNTSIKMEGLPKATYFLRVAQEQKLLKTFKIIKN